MINTRTFAGIVVCLVLATHSLHSQDRSRYRNFELGKDLSSISTMAGVPASEARTIHLRPAMMQELLWKRPYVSTSGALETDSVKQIMFSFFSDQLSKMVVDYDQERTAGMTDADLIAALSTDYGPQLKSAVATGRGATTSSGDMESGTPVARWGDVTYSVVLYRSSSVYSSRIRLVVTSLRLDALARTADSQAVRLDQTEAPAREIAKRQKEADDARAAQEKARLANTASFRP